VLYDILQKEDGTPRKFLSAENVIIEKCNNLQRFFEDVHSEAIFDRNENGNVVLFADKEAFSQRIAERYGLQCNEIPDKLKNLLIVAREPQESGRKRLIRLLRADDGPLCERISRLERKLEDFRVAQRAVGSSDNKYGKKQYRDVRHGTLARELARSFVEWLPTPSKGKSILTGLNFNVLTSTLATFGAGTDYRAFYDTLVTVGLLEDDHPHPFLEKVLGGKGAQNIEQLYEKYLEVEIDYLRERKGDLQQLRVKDSKLEALPFVHHQRDRWRDRTYKELADKYLHQTDGRDATMLLPDGLFTPWLKAIMLHKYANNQELKEALSNEAASNNASYLIHAYLTYVMQDEVQPYYWSRTEARR